MKIERKIAIGYTIIVALIGGIVYTYLHEWRQMNRLEREVKEIHRLRQSVHEAYVHMLDLTMFGETILEWERADTTLYRAKRLKVDSILCEFKDYYSGERIDSLRVLMAEKEIQLFNISKLFEKQVELGEELAERVPVIAYESTQEPPKKKGGFLGLFKKKEKPQSTTTTKLYTLNRDVIKKQSEQSRQLSETADSLAHRNYVINQQLKDLIAAMDGRVTEDLQAREQQIIKTRERTKVYLGGITAFIFIALIASYFVIMRDYGKKERGRRKLEESNRKNAELLEMRNKIILTISHDIRGPLNNIIGYTDLAMDTREKKKRNLQLKKVLGRSKHILHLVNNLLDVYRLNQAKETMHPVPFRISDLLNRVVDGATQPINDKGLLFEHEFIGADTVVKGDVDRIEQIISNLIANAIKFTSAGYIRFNVTYMDGTFTMKVSDTGMGMTEDMMKRIYLPFERAANAENSDGYGLGLPIAHGIVTMLGGTINVESELNKGTTFTVTLPLPVTNEPIEEESVSFDASLHLPKNVIAIDDDMLQLELVKEMLERNGVSCTICSKVDKLTEELRKKNYDLLLSDIQMPNTDGFKLLELLRKSRIGNSKDIPIVAMTARSESEREALLEAGFDGCIFKPFSMNELLKVIASVVKGREPGSDTDFSMILANVSDKKKILRTMIESCEKDIVDLKIAMTAENRESMRSIAHRMFPMWEIVSMDEILLAYRNVLKDSDCDTQTVLNHTNHIITHIEHLIEDAGNEIERIADEEKNIDSRG
ncbi:hybrid sensor histidine kinase/response regulator [Barnesiella intestinihominis]|jgi:two-component system sensor histidine kinase|uniref:hybrid sensor histidine kinase/response regulator n=1 Tax=Barnesiella intestinihominis TaxID=487174 RepID=UPI0039931B42